MLSQEACHLAQLSVFLTQDKTTAAFLSVLAVQSSFFSPNKDRDKQPNSSLQLPGSLETRTTNVLVQHVTPPKYNLWSAVRAAVLCVYSRGRPDTEAQVALCHLMLQAAKNARPQ